MLYEHETAPKTMPRVISGFTLPLCLTAPRGLIGKGGPAMPPLQGLFGKCVYTARSSTQEEWIHPSCLHPQFRGPTFSQSATTPPYVSGSLLSKDPGPPRASFPSGYDVYKDHSIAS